MHMLATCRLHGANSNKCAMITDIRIAVVPESGFEPASSVVYPFVYSKENLYAITEVRA